MALSVDDTGDRVEQLITLTERLTGLMAQDVVDFAARRPGEAAKRADEVARLANIYRHESARVKKDPSLIADVPAPARARLKTATEVFNATLTRHAQAMEAARQVSEGLIQAIAEELNASRPGGGTYGPRARGVAGTQPIALNRKA